MRATAADNQAVYVVCLGASTAIGRDAWASAAAARAGVSGFVDHPTIDDRVFEPMRVAAAPWLDGECQGSERYRALLAPALEQALAPLDGARVPVVLALGLPASRPGLPAGLESDLRAFGASSQRLAAIGTFGFGHAAGAIGLEAGCSKLRDGTFEACVVAGVDSYLAPETLDWLEDNDQVHGAGALNNAWGFIPGEAAGAVLLATGRSVDRLGLRPLAQVLGVGRGVEPNRIKSQTVCIGQGLAAAFRNACAGLAEGEKVSDVFCDMNGERYRADEFGFAVLRTKEFFASASDFVAPADCWGDVGAASVPLGLILSVVAATKSYANGTRALTWASSENGERAAVLLDCAHAQG